MVRSFGVDRGRVARRPLDRGRAMAGHQPREAEELFSVTVNPARAEEGPAPTAGPPAPPPTALEAGLPTAADETADPEPRNRAPAPEAIR